MTTSTTTFTTPTTSQASPVLHRLAAFGLAGLMTLVTLTGIGSLAETQAARPDAAYANAPTQQVVVVAGQRSAGS